ncbi:gamma-mobile-trio recombinase GmtY [Hydrogenophaga sp.]|uniref:gamma-mobile-trio recombinase GmtY n=1 Tax=Hydrogenophaga sp. TaxID=1904254 RepID=UPI0027305E38|nr:gamma-mobile-trio recombinase GmtY [Hydrogenophaga sp.]MDP1688169.1 gamma-mobile-trio recombinase GmtY [Hydrogenophaga sp.]
MHRTVVRAQLHLDNTGMRTEIPVILTEHGPINSLVDYLAEMHLVKSQAWMDKVVQGVGLLLDYMAAHKSAFSRQEEMFGRFAQRLTTGTIGMDGTDPSGLYWKGKQPSHVRQLVGSITGFSEWLSRREGTKPLNPWREATRGEEMLAWAAWHQRRNQSFLAHLWDPAAASMKMAREIDALLSKTPIVDRGKANDFPAEHLGPLLMQGFIAPGKQKSPRVEERLNLRNILITLLMHCGGLRVSEPFHLWCHDVQDDPLQPGCAWVRVFHPRLGTAPRDWQPAKGRMIRGIYLQGKHAMLPRNEYSKRDQLHAGWKGNLLESKDHCVDVYWFPAEAGRLFWKLWILYMAQRSQLECDHPFAFVTQSGKPYAIRDFTEAHGSAVLRIGLTPSKALGTTCHGHRHAYGQALRDAGLDPIEIKKALHHKSLGSQAVYTEPNRVKLLEAMQAADRRQGANEKPARIDPLAFGFEDVDPNGWLSGPSPKLKRKI